MNMKRPIKIAASIMCADPLNLERDISILESCGVDILHLDLMDGHFVRNITLGLESIQRISRFSKLPKEIHMLTHKPNNFINDLPLTSRDTLIFHVESVKNLKWLSQTVKKAASA